MAFDLRVVVVLVVVPMGIATDENFSLFSGVRPSVYSSEGSDSNPESAYPEIPLHAWRTLTPWHVQRVGIAANVETLSNGRVVNRSLQTAPVSTYALHKRQILRDLAAGRSLHYAVTVGANIPAVYLLIDRVHTAQLMREWSSTREVQDDVELTYDTVSCASANTIGASIRRVRANDVFTATIKHLIRSSFVDWCKHFSSMVTKDCDSLLIATSGDNSTLLLRFDRERWSRFPNITRDASNAVVDETGVTLSHDVAWFLRWNELPPFVRRRANHLLRESYRGRSGAMGIVRYLMEPRDPTNSTVEFDYGENDNGITTRITAISLRDVLFAAMGEYVGAVTVDDTAALTNTDALVPALEPWCDDLSSVSMDTKPERTARHHRAVERATLLATTLTKWKHHIWPTLRGLLTVTHRTNAKIERLLGESYVDFRIMTDALRAVARIT